MSVCMECNSNFLINEREQEFFAMRNLSLPKRCKPCRDNRKQQIRVETAESPENTDTGAILSEIYCDNCGKDAKVPFKPQPNRKAYCKVCWNGIKNVGVAAEFV